MFVQFDDAIDMNNHDLFISSDNSSTTSYANFASWLLLAVDVIQPYSTFITRDTDDNQWHQQGAFEDSLIDQLSSHNNHAVNLRSYTNNRDAFQLPVGNNLFIRICQAILEPDLQRINATQNPRNMHMFVMAERDAIAVNRTLLGRFWVNGLIAIRPEFDDNQSVPDVLAWQRNDNGSIARLQRVPLPRFFVRTQSDGDRCTEADIFLNQFHHMPSTTTNDHELLVMGDIQRPKQFNVTDHAHRHWTIVGDEWSLAQLIAARLGAQLRGSCFKWSTKTAIAAHFQQPELLPDREAGLPMRSFHSSAQVRADIPIGIFQDQPLDVVAMLGGGNRVLLTNVLSEFSNHSQRAWPHEFQAARIVVPSQIKGAQSLDELLRQQSLVVVVLAAFSAVFTALQIGFERTLIRRMDRMAIVGLMIDTVARILSVSVNESGGRTTRAAQVWLCGLSLAAMAMSTQLSGVFYEQFMNARTNEIDTMTELNASGLPVMVSEELMNTMEFWEKCVRK